MPTFWLEAQCHSAAPLRVSQIFGAFSRQREAIPTCRYQARLSTRTCRLDGRFFEFSGQRAFSSDVENLVAAGAPTSSGPSVSTAIVSPSAVKNSTL